MHLLNGKARKMKLKRYNIVAPDDGDIGWDLEENEKGDMVYYDDIEELEEAFVKTHQRIRELEEKNENLSNALEECERGDDL